MIRRPMFLTCLLYGALAAVALAEVPHAPWFPQAPKLAAPEGDVLRVGNVDELFKAARSVKPGGTILLADGRYLMPRYFEITTDNVTLRSASGDRTKVVIDGAQSRHGELIGITGCSGVTIADLTVQNIKYNGIKINSNQGAQRVTVRNCVIHNIWQRGVKAPGLKQDIEKYSPRDCVVEYCLFYNDRQKQFADDPTDTSSTFNGNYIGGIDVKNTIDWRISNNVFLGIQGRTREGRGCIYISENGQGCVIENNIFLDSDIAIALGNPSLELAKYHAVNCIARNNLVADCPETGILACYTQDCEISNNTIVERGSKRGRLIWAQHSNDGLKIADNLLVGAAVKVTSDSTIQQENNVTVKTFAATDQSQVGQSLLAPAQIVQAVELPKQRETAQVEKQTALVAVGKQPAEVIAAMKKVHAGFKGNEGYVAQFGDSITYSMAFWTAFDWAAPEQYLTHDDGLPKTPVGGKRWRDVIQGTRNKGGKFANYSGWKVGNLLRTIDEVLARDKPEVALLMIGTNDISGGKVPESYEADLRKVIEKITAAHCVPIVNTIPPRRNRDEAVAAANTIIRKVAKDMNVPLADFHAEIVRLRPDGSWDGTVISKDGVHPSGGKTHVYTEDNLKECGYGLRNWVNFLVLRQIHFKVLHAD